MDIVCCERTRDFQVTYFDSIYSNNRILFFGQDEDEGKAFMSLGHRVASNPMFVYFSISEKEGNHSAIFRIHSNHPTFYRQAYNREDLV